MAPRIMTTIIAAPAAPRGQRRANLIPPRSQRGRGRAREAWATTAMGSWFALLVPQAWIEPAVEEVHAEIHHDIHKGYQEDQGLHQRIVPAGHRLHEQQAETFRLKTCSVTTSPPSKKANSRPITVRTGSRAFFKAWTLDNEALPEPLSPRRPDVIFPQHFEHG